MQDLGFKLLSVTEAAALASYKYLGIGNEKEADRVAVDAMRKSLNLLEINGTVVIGEGERD
ncbi:MAG: fructose-bisphosphatase class II, partial [Rickettsia endosymbiont of Ixodes persulcatus]|nr:fructose-bisphosphatase class II [Rickettsia endosymbiont of Ixodes persulcatus]